jgi:Tfp pilus assembly protein PilO
MDALKNLGFKGQMGVMLVLMAVIGFGGYKFWPNIEQQKQTITRKQKKLDELNAEITKGLNLEKKLPELEREIANLEAQLEQLKAIMPPDQIDSEIVRKFEELAGRSRLSINKISPGRRQKKEFYDEYPISLDVEANYHDLGLFFARLAQLPRIFNVNAVSMKQRLSASTSISANFRAVTFIYREDAQASSTPSKG